MRIIISFSLLLVLRVPLFAITFYLSARGSDSNTGTSKAQPWQTLEVLKVSVERIQPGDSVLFERGSTFTGSLRFSLTGTKEKPIYIGAYGTGPNPILTGSMMLSKWTVFKEMIWVTECLTCTTEPVNLLINGKEYATGRYPDSGYRSLIPDDQHTFRDTSLSMPIDRAEGAEIVIRSSRWTIDKLPFLKTSGDKVHYTGDPSYALAADQGYFIQKHPGTLTKHGEWYFDPESKRLFLLMNSSTSPGNQKIAVSQYPIGLTLHQCSFITLESIDFIHYQESGLLLTESGDVKVNGIVIKHSGLNGMEVADCRNPSVQNCRIENSSNNGVMWTNNSNGEFIHNKITKTGMIAGQGSSGNGTYIGLTISGDLQHTQNKFQYNSIDSTGYIGIDFRSGGNIIRNNLIQNFCLIKDDGAGIYTWGNRLEGNIIEGNIILDGKGNGEGTSQPSSRYASGIYIDDLSANIIIKDNTIAHCAQSGIFIHNSGNITITNNTLFENGNHLFNKEKSQLYLRQDELVKTKVPLELNVSHNRFITTDENSNCINWRVEKRDERSQPGVFSANHYFAPASRQVAAIFSNDDALCKGPENYDLLEWKKVFALDVDSDFKKVPGSFQASGKRRNMNTERWMTWPDGSKRSPCPEPTANCISVTPEAGSEALLYQADFSLKRNGIYRVSFTARSNSKSAMEFVSLMANSPWAALTDYTCFNLDTTFKTYRTIFIAQDDCSAARLNFKNNQPWQMKEVLLEEIALAPEHIKLIFNASEKDKKFTSDRDFYDINNKHYNGSFELGAYQSVLAMKEATGSEPKK